MVKLSICIPTYNRAEFLKQAILSVIKQMDDIYWDQVEIAISDNHSKDNSNEIVKKIQEDYPQCHIVFDSADKNYGPDRNYLRAVSLAHGEYCWFLGSDDMITKNSLKMVLDELKHGHTIYLTDRFNADKTFMNIIGRKYFFNKEINCDQAFSFKDSRDWDFYLNRCNALGCLFSYLSSIVFKRESWNDVADCEDYIGTAYVHVAKLLNVLYSDKSSSLKYLSNPIVLNRKGNDSFYTNIYERTMLDIDGYLKLSDIFAEDKIIQEGIRRVIKREHAMIHWRMMVKITDAQFDDLLQKLKLIGYDEKEIELIVILRRHKLLVHMIFALEKLKKIIRKNR